MMPLENMEVTKGTNPRLRAKAKVMDMAMGVVAHKVEVVEIVNFAETKTHQESVLHAYRHVLNVVEKHFAKVCRSRRKSQSQDCTKGQRQSRSKS